VVIRSSHSHITNGYYPVWSTREFQLPHPACPSSLSPRHHASCVCFRRLSNQSREAEKMQ
jgi:hypothetical protein